MRKKNQLIPLFMLLTVASLPVLAEEVKPAATQPNHMLKMMDGDGDGRVSKQEFMDKRAQHFEKMDANKDGFLDQQEATEMREKMGGMMQKMRERQKQPASGSHTPEP